MTLTRVDDMLMRNIWGFVITNAPLCKHMVVWYIDCLVIHRGDLGVTYLNVYFQWGEQIKMRMCDPPKKFYF